MVKEESGLASEIDWNEVKIVAFENRLRQRKAREVIETLREKKDGKAVLNMFEQSTAWQPTI